MLHLMAMICLLQANSLLVASEGWETIIEMYLKTWSARLGTYEFENVNCLLCTKVFVFIVLRADS